MTLAGDEFLRRFLLHELPRDFAKVRRYGLLANRYRQHGTKGPSRSSVG
jgi:hypothetical protein